MPEFVVSFSTMMEKQTRSDISPVPPEITSPEAKLVYLYIEAAGAASVEDLNQTLAMKKIAILSVLNSLRSRGFVEQRSDEYVVADG